MIVAALVVLVGGGCEPPPITYLEVRRIDEPLTDAEIDTLTRISAQMPDERLPPLSPHFLPPPQWDAQRPATIATLAKEELERLRESTQLSVLANSNGRNPRLRHALAQEKLTTEQYTALLLAVGLALQRSRVDPARDLERYVRDGLAMRKKLAKRSDSFAALPTDEQIRALDDATWITRTDRAQRLLQVPPENVELAFANSATLGRILPPAFRTDPLAEVSDPLRDYGVPFR